MATNNLPSRVSYFQETTQGTPPASAAAWNASGFSFRHVAGSVDLSSLVSTMLEDQRSQLQILDDEPMIEGIAGGGSVEVPTEAYLHGIGQSPADGSAVTQDAIGTLVAHCWGGSALGTSDELVAAGAHSTTAVELTDTLAVGTWIGLDDASGLTHLRRVESTAAGGVGVVHTLHRELPFTPDDGDLARGCAVYYLDEDVLEDSTQGPYTLSMLYERGRGSQRETWQTAGCKMSVASFKLARNELASVSFVTRVGSFLTPNSSPVPTWSADPTGSAGSVVGPRTQVWLQDAGSTGDATVQVSTFELTPGIMSVPVEVQTEDSNLPGLFGYTLARNPCTLAMTLVPHADTPLADFTSRQEKSIQWERLAAAGQAWSLYLPRATYSGTPTAADASTVLGQTLNFNGHHDDNQTSAVARSRVQLVRC